MNRSRYQGLKFLPILILKMGLVLCVSILGDKGAIGRSNLKQGDNYDQGKQMNVEGGYQPSDYANLPVSMEVK